MSLCFSDYDTRYALYLLEDIAEISSMRIAILSATSFPAAQLEFVRSCLDRHDF
jgi:hypothetical protein